MKLYTHYLLVLLLVGDADTAVLQFPVKLNLVTALTLMLYSVPVCSPSTTKELVVPEQDRISSGARTIGKNLC